MLEKSDVNISGVLASFTLYGLEVGLIVPTDTGMAKSIMDATSPIRTYLYETGFHSYAAQEKGPDNKIVKRAFFVWPDRLEETTVSLYRPETKNGDPRIWFSRLKEYARPFNLLALLVRGDTVYVVNCSKDNILDTLGLPKTPLGKIVLSLKPEKDPAVEELLELLKAVSARGFIPTMRPGDTGVGATLETALGIAANANKTPDYKGIEIKAKRLRKGSPNRVTLFSQVPNWKLSPIGSAWGLLSMYGYHRAEKLRLNHEMNSKAPNSLGFILELDTKSDWLKQNHQDLKTNVTKHLITWEMQKLRSRLIEKHPQTFWVSAKCQGVGVDERFHYIEIEHSKTPSIRNFDALIEGGVISVDYLMSEKAPGRVRDHGYLFKINPKDFQALFPPTIKYRLSAQARFSE